MTANRMIGESGSNATDASFSGWKTAYAEDEVEHVACPSCDSRNSRDLATEWTLVVACCRDCGLTYVRRRPRNPEYAYRADRAALLAKYGDVLAERRPHTRERNYAEMLRRLERHAGVPGRLLDVGTHMGFFARRAVQRSWQVVGVEPSPVLATVAREELGLDVRNGYLHEFDFEQEFDAATFLDVLEHVASPVEILTLVRRALRPGGVILVKVPNARWNQLKFRVLKPLLGDRIDAWDAREHVVHFTQETLEATLRQAALEPVEVFIPLPVPGGGAIRRGIRRSAYAAGRLLRAAGATDALCPDLVIVGRRPADS